MATSLKYNLSEYNSAVNGIKDLRLDIEKYKTSMIESLEQIRKDWTTEGGITFFASIDGEWEEAIQNCMYILDDLIKALDDAYVEYKDIADDAKNYLKI